MMYSDIALQVAIKFNELPAEKQILIVSMVEDINQKRKGYVTSKVKTILQKIL